jgi:hypothetical protein
MKPQGVNRAMPFTHYFYDRFVSKGFGTLEKQLLLPFTDEQRSFSVPQFVLNTVFCMPLEEKTRARGVEYDPAYSKCYRRIRTCSRSIRGIISEQDDNRISQDAASLRSMHD